MLPQSQVIDAVSELLENDVKSTDKLIKKASDSRLDFDAKQASFKSAVESKKATQVEIDSAQSKADEAETLHNSLKREVLVCCKSIEDKKKALVVSKFGDYAKAATEGAEGEISAAKKFTSAN